MILKTLRIPLILMLFLSGTGIVRAQDSSEDKELSQFLNLLEEQTLLATDTRLNADFVPGMFSIVTGEQLERRGYRILWEALAAVPGVLTTQNETGMRSISVRGVGEIFETSKVKLLLNGKALNASASATSGTLYNTPVDQIERIEVIRGPGSAIHGEFAYAGVVNVITRKEGEKYTAGIETDEGFNFSLLKTFGDGNDNFSASLDLAASQAEGQDIDSGPDRSTSGIPSYSPGPINNKRDFVSAIVNLEFDDITTLIQFQQGNRGDHFGTNNLLPPDERQTVISDEVLSIDLSQPFVVNGQVDGEWSINLLQNTTEQNELFLGVPEAFGGLGNEDDVIADTLLEERRLEARLNLQYRGERHKLLGEIVITDIEVTESEQFINLDPITTLPTAMMNEFPGPVDEDAERRALSLVLQDEYAIDNSLTLTAGLRFDDYDEIGSNTSPRIALVWRQSDKQIYKAQLARAFRPPSLIEEGGAIETSIEAETNDTLEFGHIYHGTDLVVRNTVYFSELDDLIVFEESPPFGYKNTGSFDLTGYEFEVEKQVANRWDIHASLSLQNYGDEELPGATPWLVKLGIGYQLLPLTEIHVQIDSAGTRERESEDTRSDFEQTTQVDLALRRQNFLEVDGLDFRLGVRNLLDDELHHPSPTGTYTDDYPYSDGAMLWAQILYRP